jgi:hypothetical protein
MMTKRILTALMAVLIVTAGSASAAVMVEASQEYGTGQTDISGGTFSFQSASDNVFAVALFQFVKDDPAPAPTVTLDPTGMNVSLTELVTSESVNNGDLHAYLFAAEIGDVTAGDLDWTVTADSGNFGAAAYQLSNAMLAGAKVGGTGVKDDPIDLADVADGSAGIDLHVDGSNSTGASPYTTPDSTFRFVATANRGFVSSYYTGLADDVQLGYNGAAAQVSVAGAFAPIPEPATMSLLALGGLGVLIRRKKK